MTDFSHLDKKYFIDNYTYNCPFCNRNHVPFTILQSFSFDWTENKKCYGMVISCLYCNNYSLHLSYTQLVNTPYKKIFSSIEDLDSLIFYSVPTSFFVLDARINATIRELITEAEGCLKMNFLTGASACIRKAIYELLILEKSEGIHYEDKIKSLKRKHKDVDVQLFNILGHIQEMTSDKVHEQSWDKWDSKTLTLIIETLKEVLYEIYVIPLVKKARNNKIKQLREDVDGKDSQEETDSESPPQQ